MNQTPVVYRSVAVKSCVLLACILLIDAATRLWWHTEVTTPSVEPQTEAMASTTGLEFSVATMESLLAWSDPIVKNANTGKKNTQSTKAKQGNKPAVNKVKQRINQVKQAVANNANQQVIGDDLLTLRGIFDDGTVFAVIEVENIRTSEKQYLRLAANQQQAGYKLIEVSNNQILIARAAQQVKLKMCD